jgi:hypothetical protein
LDADDFMAVPVNVTRRSKNGYAHIKLSAKPKLMESTWCLITQQVYVEKVRVIIPDLVNVMTGALTKLGDVNCNVSATCLAKDILHF